MKYRLALTLITALCLLAISSYSLALNGDLSDPLKVYIINPSVIITNNDIFH